MPSVSDSQRRFMAAAANNPGFARQSGIDQSVAKEFNLADTAKAPHLRGQGKKLGHQRIARALMGGGMGGGMGRGMGRGRGY